MKPAQDHSARLLIQAAFQASDWPLLVKRCQQALRKNSKHPQAHQYLGYALHQQRQTDAALQAFQHAGALFPNHAELLINHGNLLIELARTDEALPLLERVCQLAPNHALSWIKLAQCCYQMGLSEQGYAAALQAQPLATTVQEHVAILTQKAIHGRELGHTQQAIADCVAAIALHPLDTANHTNRLLFMLADANAGGADMRRAAEEYGQMVEAPLKPHWPNFTAHHQGGPWRRLKVGFLSPDFRNHSVMYFVEGILAQLDRRQFEVFAFYLFPRSDNITERVERQADHFIRLAGLSDEARAAAIAQHGIDILIDLAGHTGHNGLQTMARKPAPLQISWLGYPATTGLTAIDYKISDDVTDPPGADDQYTERLCRLPVFFTCYRPMCRNPLWRYQPRYQVQPTPALRNRHITFGSCNNLGKLTPEVLTLWGQLLQRMPTARLLIEGKNLGKPAFAVQYRAHCAALGIDPERLDLVGLDPAQQYLTYHRIDIALDPYPLTGGTTTFDVLWMGVPLVSMVGSVFKSRMTTGILTYLGQTAWIANSPEDYLHIATTLASDIDNLNAMRQQLRPHLEQSSLMREDLFSQQYGHALRAMWVHWLAEHSHPGDAAAQAAALDAWQTQAPPEWNTPQPPSVGLSPGKRCTQAQAHQHLEAALAKAKTAAPTPLGTSATKNTANTTGHIHNPHWIALTELAETVLCAIPHDPLALACLAEVEMAHGHTEFAMTYLRCATEALAAGGALEG